ncbi:D-alanine/D-alanine ligase [Kribbella flavida DSM 17836]|uniref:D-alanine--D-alanine ligase n=1 Tax=Kribbella flavida (strain DSM 17836 / JCM 10339 / NBRC 14399) TaxID=479435 RepID=D2PYQ7_KRIFD|nr:D-alanine--D-alanine ligase family protein [Kribbella flavida]ADB29903.1 D-alanine/D-alanine ligase [Kribbella flavida DSM 17836]
MKVAVISGGASPEHDVSLASGQGIARAAAELGHTVLCLVIEPDGTWRDGQHEAIELLQFCDVVVPALHGQGGEDGVIQGFLQQLGVPYVGSGVAASAVGLDKHLTKAVLRAHGLPVAPGITLRGADLADPESVLQRLKEASIDLPVFVKPGNGGSSFGVTRVTDSAELGRAVADAAGLDSQVLVEQEIRGREIDLAVMEFPDGRIEAGPALEIHSDPARPFFDTTAKYAGAGTRFVVPAPLDPALAASLRRTAVEVFQTLGCAGLARVDFFVPADGQPVVNEVNTFPGFTPASQFPRMWAAAGMSYPELVHNLLETARARTAR